MNKHNSKILEQTYDLRRAALKLKGAEDDSGCEDVDQPIAFNDLEQELAVNE